MTSTLPFEKMGPYRIERLLGRGGMGMVFAARHEQTSQTAAVKVLSPALALSGSYRERFDAEVESLRQLQHPHIVRLYGFGEQQGHLFYAMELVEGRNLQEELSAGRRFSWRDVTSIAIQICSALKHAHDHGIVHRDLKPANLLMADDDHVKLGDFGIAKLFGATLVTHGGVLGTADYMAPEQARGENSGHRCDLYSLGAVMYALLTGKPPHTGKSVPEVLHKLRYEAPIPVARLAHDLPDELEKIVMQLIEKDPRRRLPTALATSNRLQAMQRALSITPKADEVITPPAPLASSARRDQLAQQPTVEVELDAKGRPVDPHLDASIISPLAASSAERATATDRSHFTPVSPPPPDEAHRREPVWTRAVTVAGLTVALVIVALLVWRTLAPPTADQLYARVLQMAGSDDPATLTETERAIEQFAARFPQDPRRDQLEQIRRQIELERLERRLEGMARRGAGQQLTAAQQLYLEAVRLAEEDPARAAARLEALVQLGAAAGAETPQLQRVGELARQRLESLEHELQQQAQQHHQLIEQLIERADQLGSSQPQTARQILEALLELYQHQPFAESLLGDIRSRLDALDP